MIILDESKVPQTDMFTVRSNSDNMKISHFCMNESKNQLAAMCDIKSYDFIARLISYHNNVVIYRCMCIEQNIKMTVSSLEVFQIHSNITF